MKTKMQKQPSRYEELVKDLVLQIRGHRSQESLRKKFNATYNICSKWERGKKQVSWTEFVLLCKLCKVDLQKVMFSFFGIRKLSDSSKLVEHFVGNRSAKEFAGLAQVSPASLGRWLRKQSEPNLSNILQMIDLSGDLIGFISNLVDAAKMESVQTGFLKQTLAKEVFSEFPETPMILCFIDLRQYQGAPLKPSDLEFFSKTLNLPIKRLHQIFRQLEMYGLVSRENGAYRTVSGNVTTNWNNAAQFYKTKSIKSYWLKRSLDALNKVEFSNQAMTRNGYQVFVSCESLDQILQQECRQFYERIYNRIEEHQTRIEKEATTIQVFSYQLFRAID